MRKILIVMLSALPLALLAQKKPLDHSVYDRWQSVQGSQISNDGKWVVYQVSPQEGDGDLIIQSIDGVYKKTVERGYGSIITNDSRYLVFKIRPLFKDTRDARIKKKRLDEMPKDSMAIIELGKDDVWKTARVKTFKTPEKGNGWLAYHLDKALPEAPKPAPKPDSLTQINKMMSMADSLLRVADSLKNKANEAKTKGLSALQAPKRETRPNNRPAADPVEEGTELVVRNMQTGEEKKFALVSEYYFSEQGNVLLIETTRKNADTLSKATVYWMNTATGKIDTVLKGFNDAKNYAMDEAGTKLAFVAERDSASKSLKKFYKLYHYKNGMDSARLRADRNTAGVKSGLTISPDYINRFSKNGNRLFFGLALIRQPKDTTLVEFETAKLDIWHYDDLDLQPQQLVQAGTELRRSYVAVLNGDATTVTMLSDATMDRLTLTPDADADVAVGFDSRMYRKQNQWEQHNYSDAYVVNVNTGERKLISKKIRSGTISPTGKYMAWFDWKKSQYVAYDITSGKTSVLTADIKVPLFDEDDDHPDDPPPHGIMGWHEGDAALYVYDKFDIWKLDMTGKNKPVNITNGIGRKKQLTFRNIDLDRDALFVKDGETLLLSTFDNKEKGSGFVTHKLGSSFSLNETTAVTYPVSISGFGVQKAKDADAIIYTAATPQMSGSVFASTIANAQNHAAAKQLSFINEQQKEYNWYTVELHKWKMFDGKESEGLLFKPENFDPNKKYPVIFYFYERNSDTRYSYRTPAPSASTVNIAYFTSNGYLVFDPNIYYKDGEPGESAYNSVVSAAKYLSKMKFVDSTKMAIQGQSWGGYQVAYLITRTKMFAAAGAGAPVANMFSAYGGIRWGAGISRQFQYERSQTRFGATPWQRPDLYIKNSPLFKADKVTTPLLMMHNDKDGAVPWYQGIEYFTALRRLDKKVWLLQYNEEDHNLVERRNRKDLSIRLAQFFDHYLKGAPLPKWMKDGVPATDKGIDWGLDIVK